MLSKLLYDDDLAVMSKIIEGIINKFIKCKKAFVENCLKVSH